MKFISDGPDIPDDLVAAQARGDVLFVCGAGVSINFGLPTFKGLVERVYEHLGESWDSHPEEKMFMDNGSAQAGRYDRMLRALERRFVGDDEANAKHWREKIRDTVASILSAAPNADVKNHKNLLGLSKNRRSETRLIMTSPHQVVRLES
jgi:hypothetical protein